MAKQVSLKKNFIMNAILSLSSFIFPLITYPYINRVLETLNKGKVITATSVISYFVMFSQLGIPAYGVKLCASVRDDKEKLSKAVHELLLINLAIAVIAYIGLFGTVLLIPSFRSEITLFAVMCPNILLSALGIEWLYKALEKYDYITVRSLIFKVIAVISMFLLVHKREDYVIYGGITIFASTASSILNFINARKYIYFRKLDGYNFKRHFKATLAFFAMSCATTVYLHLDTLMLKFLSGTSDEGFSQTAVYDTAVKVKSILTSIVTSLGAVLLPRASYYFQQNRMDEFRKITKKALNLVFVLSLPLMVYFMFYARDAVLFISPKSFLGAVLPMQTIMPTIVFIGITNIIGFQILIPSGRINVVLKSVVLGAVVDLVFNFALIPFIQCEGAAIGTLLAEIAVLIYQLIYMYRHRDIVDIIPVIKNISFWKIAIAIVISSACCIVFKFWQIPVKTDKTMLVAFVNLAVSAIAFFIPYCAVMLLLKETMAVEAVNTIAGKFKGLTGKLRKNKAE